MGTFFARASIFYILQLNRAISQLRVSTHAPGFRLSMTGIPAAIDENAPAPCIRADIKMYAHINTNWLVFEYIITIYIYIITNSLLV